MAPRVLRAALRVAHMSRLSGNCWDRFGSVAAAAAQIKLPASDRNHGGRLIAMNVLCTRRSPYPVPRTSNRFA
jgi:hypothetical protein